MIAAKAFDPVMGIDIHIIQPPGPVPPVPIPHPFIGMLVDPMDFAPIIGATVMVNGMPRATAGTGGKCIPPHIPIGGVFVKPPASECEIFMGSSTVLADGDPLSFLGMPCLSCHDVGMPPPPRPRKKRKTKSLTLPTSVVLAIPAGAPVLVGGPPTVSMMALGMKAAMAGLGKAFKKLKKLQKGSKKMKALSDKVQRAAKKAMDKLGVPPSIQNKVHRSICSVTGHPVDVATGKVFTEMVDFELPGPIPFKWERVWYSCSVYPGPLGHGWHHRYDMALVVDTANSVIALRMTDGRPAAFPLIQEGETYHDRTGKQTIFRDRRGYALRDSSGLIYRFDNVADTEAIHQLISIEDNTGNHIGFERDGQGRLAGIADSAGRSIRFEHDEAGRISALVLPHPDQHGSMVRGVTYHYDGHGDLTEVRDAVGGTTRYVYRNHLLVEETDRTGLSFYFSYDWEAPGARCVRTWGTGGIYDHTISYFPDRQETLVQDSLGAPTRYGWTHDGLVSLTVNAVGGKYTTEFNEYFELVAKTGPCDWSESFEYDNRGNCVRKLTVNGPISFRYDGDRITGCLDNVGGQWSWRYDDFGRLTERENPVGEKTLYVYDGARLHTIVDGTGGRTRFFWDAECNLLRVVTEDGRASVWEYDRLGRPISAMNPAGFAEERRYDLLGRLTWSRTSDGRVRARQYDGEGHLTAVQTDENRTEFGYFGRSRLAWQNNGAARVEFRYDTEERLIGVVNEKGRIHQFELDAVGEVIAETAYDGSARRFVRDRAGRVIRIERASGIAAEYEHDVAGNVVNVGYSDGSFEAFKYRADGLVIEAANAATSVSLERDLIGRILSETQADGSVQSHYDAHGLRLAVQSSAGGHQTIERDPGGHPLRLAYLEQHDGTQLKWESASRRDRGGLELERSLPGGIRAVYQRDVSGRPTSFQVTHAESVHVDLRYSWGSGDRLLDMHDAHEGVTRYSHTDTDHLYGAEYPDGQRDLRVPDASGNIYRTPYRNDRTYGPSGDLLEVMDRSGVNQYAYDRDGNLIRKTTADGDVWQYHWTASGLLQAVDRPDGQRIEFTYDPFGRRIRKTGCGLDVTWLWDGDRPLHEWTMRTDTQNSVEPRDRVTWLFEPDSFRPIAMIQKDKQYSIINDHVGAPIAALAETSEVSWRGRLNIYGGLREAGNGASGAIPFRYPGHYEDSETGLHYNRFRYYDPDTGRYISRDPIGLLGGLAPYAYVNDPLAWIDPKGLDGCTPSDVVGFGNATKPRPPRPGKDIDVDAAGNVHPPKADEWPSGASTFASPDQAPLSGHYHKLPAGTELPPGLGIKADGSDVGGPNPPGHHTIYPTETMPYDEFAEKFGSLPWEHAGKK